MKVGFYPGCSLEGSGVEYMLSIKALATDLGIELAEIEDWNCCGATAAHSLSHDLALGLGARILSLAAEQGHSEIFAPCAACYSRLKVAAVEIAKGEKERKRLEELIERALPAKIRIYNVNELLKEKSADLAAKITKKFDGLKVACYYGCLLVRPPEISKHDDVEDPVVMDELVKLTGAVPVNWAFKTECCGGGFSISITDAVLRLVKKIIINARENGAEAILTACPMCHSNLDMRQLAMKADPELGGSMPILFISEFLALAMGKPPAEVGITKHFIPAGKLLEQMKL